MCPLNLRLLKMKSNDLNFCLHLKFSHMKRKFSPLERNLNMLRMCLASTYDSCYHGSNGHTSRSKTLHYTEVSFRKDNLWSFIPNTLHVPSRTMKSSQQVQNFLLLCDCFCEPLFSI